MNGKALSIEIIERVVGPQQSLNVMTRLLRSLLDTADDARAVSKTMRDGWSVLCSFIAYDPRTEKIVTIGYALNRPGASRFIDAKGRDMPAPTMRGYELTPTEADIIWRTHARLQARFAAEIADRANYYLHDWLREARP